ncbi:MAG: creatininase family protein [Clostridia bacterium]|nr:creatininase family protein [Clostridia bacterium]
MKWEYLREEDFEGAIERSGGLCVMTLGCLEKHGQHLPVGTDSIKGDRIVELAAEKADVVMFPTTMWLGDVGPADAYKNPSKTRKHGFIAISCQTMLTVLEELCDQIARNGFTKILICASHGGNTSLLGLFSRFQSSKDYAVMSCKAYDFTNQLDPKNVLEAAKKDPEYFSMLTEEDLKTLERFAQTGTGGGHADFKETALVYGTHPDLVAPDRFEAESGSSANRLNFPPQYGISTLLTWFANFPNDFSGYPSIGCTPTIGEAYLKLSVDRLAEIFTYLKNNDDCVDVIRELKQKRQ